MSYKVVRVTDNLVNLLRRCCEANSYTAVAERLGTHRFTIYAIFTGRYKSPFVSYRYIEGAKSLTEVDEADFDIITVPERKEVVALARKCGSKYEGGILYVIERMRRQEPWSGFKVSALRAHLSGRRECPDPYTTIQTYAFLKAMYNEPERTRSDIRLTKALYLISKERDVKKIIARWGLNRFVFETAAYSKQRSTTVPAELREIFERQAVLSPADDFYGAIKHEIIDTRIARTAKEFRKLLPILSEHIDKNGSVDSLYSASFWSDRIVLEKQHYRLMMLADLKHSKNHLQRQVRWEDFKKTLDVFRKARYSDDNICRIIGISDIHELLTPVNGTIKALAEGESIDDLARWLRNYHPKTQDISINTAKSYLREEGKDPALRGITYRFLMEREGKDPLALEEPEEEEDEPEFAGPTAEELFAARFMDYNPSYRLTAYVPDYVWAKLRDANKIETTDKKGEPLVDSRTFELKKLEVLLNSDLARGRDTTKRELAKRKILRKIQ